MCIRDSSFAERIVYQQVDARKPEQFDALAAALGEDRAPVTVCYLATAPGIFVDICKQLARVGLNTPNVRLVLEKPLGTDLASNERINSAVAEYFAEDQIYRIDHYLGKESVQNPVSYTHLTLPTSSERCRSRWSPYH